MRVVAGPAERRPDPRVDVAVVGEQALARRVVEVGPVVYARHLGRRAAEDFGSPWYSEVRLALLFLLLFSLLMSRQSG